MPSAVCRRALAALAAVLLMAGCGLIPTRPRATPPPLAAAPTPTPVPERWILIKKTAHTLSVYDGETVIRTYPAVFGKDPVWAKLYQGDQRTPEGTYHIVSKYFHPFWSRFLLLDYPTVKNQELYEWSRANDVLPERGGDVPGIGGAIGIHGAEDESLNARGINWTAGCISLFNRDVDELYRLVGVGTRVEIER